MPDRYPSIETFAARGGKQSGEMDFGMWWSTTAGRWPRYRVSVVHETGDIYALNLFSGEVVPLATLPSPTDCPGRAFPKHPPSCPYERAEALLKGWAETDQKLSWLRERLEAVNA